MTTNKPQKRILCVDLEFTYDQKNNDKVDLYDIGVVVLDGCGREVDSFQTHVKPHALCEKTLSFLSLSPADLAPAPSLDVAMKMLNEFVKAQEASGSIEWCSWGDRDKKILSSKAGRVSIPKGHRLVKSPYFDAQFSFRNKVPRARYKPRISLQEVVEDFCGSYIPDHHSALSDARALSVVVKTFLN